MGDLTLENVAKLLEKQTENINRNIEDKIKIIGKNSQTIKQLEGRCLHLERRIRKNNVILFGLSLDGTDLAEQVLQKLNDLFETAFTIAEINNVYKIGKSKSPPVIVEFVSFLRKSEIFKKPDKLRALRGTGISIAHDLCQEDRKNMKILRQHLREVRAKGQEAKIVGTKLKIGDRFYSAAELNNPSEVEYETIDDSESEEEGGKSTRAPSTQGNIAADRRVKKGASERKRKVQTPSPTYHPVSTRPKKSKR